MSHTIKLWERIIEGSYQHHRKPIWIHAREIDYGGDFFDKATYGKMYGAKERHAYNFY
jgi:hypothetical protein